MTIAPRFEGAIVDMLADLAEAGQLYKGLRATLWCIHDETALAEAEIEYQDHVSPSIYVRFPRPRSRRADIFKRFGVARRRRDLSIAIWTTTPWTLPGERCDRAQPRSTVRPLRDADGETVAGRRKRLSEHVSHAARHADEVDAAQRRGAELDRAAVRHPFLDRDSLLVAADYVELETGTGAVHTAPGHGAEDFETGVALRSADRSTRSTAPGRFTAEAGPYAGLHIFEAQRRIIDDLRASGKLVAYEAYEHSYPHCWRCKNPVIFRATAQWFIAMDANDLRQRIVAADPEVDVDARLGAKQRMTQMIENHPEWCLSRQRTWGTPIPALVCSALQRIDPRSGGRAQRGRAFPQRRRDVWWTEPVEAFLPPGFRCPKCGGTTFRKEMNIVDIWFESGVTHRAGAQGPRDAVAGRRLSRRRRSISRLVPLAT